jgi:LysR family transcriptional regulator, low CO2-responsive transcriptional regulator
MKSSHTRQIPLDSRQLNAFVSLARTGSFKETAAELFLTHSAISHSMSALENEIGCRLLTRMSKKVVLTEMGEALLHHAQTGLQEFAKARETLDNLKQWGASRLRIGAGASLSRQLLADVLSRSRQKHPRLRITARVLRPWESVSDLADGKLDLVLGVTQKTIPGIAFSPLFESSLQIVVGAEHRWAVQGHITLSELATEPCLLTPKAHATRQLIERYFAAEKIGLNVIAELDSFDAIIAGVKSGHGISVLPQWAIQDELALRGLTAFPPGRRALRQSWGIYRWEKSPITTVENTFRLLCEDASRKMTASV